MPPNQYITIFGVSLRIDLLALFGLVAQTTAAVTLTRYSKLPQGVNTGNPQKHYNNASLVATTEIIKLMASLSLIFIFDTVESISRRAKIEEEIEDVLINTHKPSTTRNETGGEKRTKKEAEFPSLTDSISATTVVFPFFSFVGIVQRYNEFRTIIHNEIFTDIIGTLKVAVPALLYTIQNNVIYIALDNLEATTFQVGYQSKVITTAVLSMMMLNRKLSIIKWISLFFLAAGIVMTQINIDGTSQVKQSRIRSAMTNTPNSNSSNNNIPTHYDITLHKFSEPSDNESNKHIVGIVAVAVASFCSALAGVYFEKILKGTSATLWVRNSQLAFFSMCIAVIGYLGTIVPDSHESDIILLSSKLQLAISGYFTGYSPLVCAIILVQSVGGLIIACVIKYADNILKGFATAISILCCGALSALFMGFMPSLIFLIGSTTVIGATMMYSFSK